MSGVQKPGANEHLGSKTVSTNVDVDIEDMIEKSGCNSIYMQLEECLGENDRDWRRCQVEVIELMQLSKRS